jgi:hypothetical protein
VSAAGRNALPDGHPPDVQDVVSDREPGMDVELEGPLLG